MFVTSSSYEFQLPMASNKYLLVNQYCELRLFLSVHMLYMRPLIVMLHRRFCLASPNVWDAYRIWPLPKTAYIFQPPCNQIARGGKKYKACS